MNIKLRWLIISCIEAEIVYIVLVEIVFKEGKVTANITAYDCVAMLRAKSSVTVVGLFSRNNPDHVK